MNRDTELTEEEYCLAQQFKQAQTAKQVADDEATQLLLTKEELAHIAVSSMSFDNIHLVAYELSISKLRCARSLYDELQYYVDKSMI